MDSEKYTFKNAVKFGLAKNFFGSNGIKFLKNSKGEIAGYELKSISEQGRLFTNEVFLNKKDSEKDSEYAIILFNDKNECNHSKIKEVSTKSELELIYCDFEANILGDQQHDI